MREEQRRGRSGRYIVGIIQQVEMARDAELMTKERLCCGLNIFEMFLVRIKDIIRKDQVCILFSYFFLCTMLYRFRFSDHLIFPN